MYKVGFTEYRKNLYGHSTKKIFFWLKYRIWLKSMFRIQEKYFKVFSDFK